MKMGKNVFTTGVLIKSIVKEILISATVQVKAGTS